MLTNRHPCPEIVLLLVIMLFSAGPVVADITYLTEGFEGEDIPAGWTRIVVSGSSDWQVNGVRASEGFHSILAPGGPPEVVQEIWLVSPPIATTDRYSFFLRFHESADFWPDFGGVHEILVSTTDPLTGSFTSVLTLTPANHTLGPAWQIVDVGLGAVVESDADPFYVAFRYLGEYADDWYIDEVIIFGLPVIDIGMGLFESTVHPVKPDETINVDLVVENLGSQDSGPYDLNYSVTDESETEVLNQTESYGGILAGETATITANMSLAGEGYYTINVTAQLPGDEDPTNDTATTGVEVMPRDLRSLAVLDIVYDETESNDARAQLDPFLAANEDVFSGLTLHKTVAFSPFYNGQMDPVRTRFFPYIQGGGLSLDLNNRREWNTPPGPPVTDWGAAVLELEAAAVGGASPMTISTDVRFDPSTDIARVISIVHNFHELMPGSENRIFFYHTRDNAEGGGYHATHLSTINTSSGQLLDNAPGVQVFEFDVYRDPSVPVEDLKVVTEVSRFHDGDWDRVVQSDAQRVVRKGGDPLLRADFDHWRDLPTGWTREPPASSNPWSVIPFGNGRWDGAARAPLGTSAEIEAAITEGLAYLEEVQLRGSVRLRVDDPPAPGSQFEVLASTGGSAFPADFTSLLTIDLTTGPPPAAWETFEFIYLPPAGTTQVRFAFAVSSPEPPGDSFLYLDDLLIEPDAAANIRMTHTRDVGILAMDFPELPILTTGPPPRVFLEVGNVVTLPGDPADFEARFMIRDQGGDVVHREVRPVAGLAAGDYLVLPFDVPALAPGRFDFIGDVMLTGDQDGFNDRIILEEVEAYEHPLVNFSLGVVNEGDPESDMLRLAVDGETSIWTSRFSHIQAHANDLMPDRFFDEDPAMHTLLRKMPHYADAAGLPSFAGEFLYPEEEYLGAKSVPWTTIVQNWLAAANSHASPMTLDTSFFWFVPNTSGQIWVDITLDHQLRDDRDYYLYATITEDDADGLGYNHVPRVLYPDVNGRLVDKYPGFFQKIFSFSLDPSWKFDDLRLVSWVVEKSPDGFEKIVQSHSRFVTDTPATTGEVPARTALTGIFPNPFNPRTTVSFELVSRERARVAVYDLSGRLVKVLADRVFNGGSHDLVWNGRDRNDQSVAAGVYLCRMEAGRVTQNGRMTLVK